MGSKAVEVVGLPILFVGLGGVQWGFFFQSDASATGFNFDPECYGETLELVMKQPPGRDGLYFSLPIKFQPELVLNHPSLRPDPKGPRDQELVRRAETTCQEEPVHVSAFYFPNIQGPLETIGLTGDGPLPRFFEVASWGVNKPVEENKKAYIDAILKRYEGYRPNVTDEGLYFYGHLNKNGLYLSKNDTEFPEEKSLRFLYIFRNDSHFSGQCDVNTYVNGAALIYRFDPKIVPMSEWLALDRRLRRLVQRLMIDPEQTPLSDG